MSIKLKLKTKLDRGRRGLKQAQYFSLFLNLLAADSLKIAKKGLKVLLCEFPDLHGSWSDCLAPIVDVLMNKLS